ncbi:hypothetical protein R1flu_015536 [Riccia fluitans]|uniref:Uncharacterized protein n=1 Tax=Riccia fluitans TaxID=41844 RepID=A0ABD1YK24_9MARC
MDDEVRHEHCEAFSNSLRRITEVIESTTRPSHEFSVIVAEVLKLVRGFKIIGRSYADQLVSKVQEVKSVQFEKQMLEKKIESLQFQLSSQVFSVLPVPAVVPHFPSTDKVTPEQLFRIEGSIKDIYLEVNLHLRCEEELERRELQLAKLRKAYTALSFDLRECLKETSILEIRLRETEKQAAKNAKERIELLKTHTREINEVKDDNNRLEGETARLRKEACNLEEQLRMATVKNEQIDEILKSDSKLKDDLKRQQKMLKIYLQYLSSRFLSTKGSEDLEIELRGLECRGFDVETTSYLRTVLETGLKAWQEHVRRKGLENGGLQRSFQIIDLETDDESEKHLLTPDVLVETL